MLELKDFDLTQDPAAGRFIKTEIVQVNFASLPGELISLEGPNRYQSGDAIITGCTGDRWSVDRHRFDTKYQAVPPTVDGAGWRLYGEAGTGAGQADQRAIYGCPFGGAVMCYMAKRGTGSMQYGPGDFGVCGQSRFARVYQKVG